MNVLIIPGHNSHADKPRFIALEKALVKQGYQVTRFSAKRAEHRPQEEITLTVTHEYEQVLALAKTLEKPIIAIGHSQGGPLALRLGYEEEVDGVITLMGDTSSQEDVNHHLRTIQKTLHEVREEKIVRFERDSGQANWYTAEFFEDCLMWNIPIYAHSNAPKLFIAGKSDPWNTPEHVAELFEEAQEPKEYQEIDCGHNFEEEHVTELAAIIKEFLEKIK